MMISIFKHYKLDIPKILISVFYTLALLIYVFLFISKENYIYYFDFGIHYAEFIQVHDLLYQKGLLLTIKEVQNSLQNSDYNLLSAFILSPFSLISTSRLTFLYATVFIYFLPSYFLLLKTLKLFASKISTSLHFLVTSLFFLSPSLIVPILRNQNSIDAFIPIFLCYFVFFGQLIKQKLDFKKIPILSLFIILPPLLHRWYLPFSLSFLFITPLISVFVFPKRHRTLLYFIFLTISSTLLFLLISGNLWQKFFLVDYSKLYQHYQNSQSLISSLNLTFSQIGYPLIFFFIIASFLLLKHQALKKYSFYLILVFSLSLGLFIHIQDPGIHHLYLVMIPLLLSISLWLSTQKTKSLVYLTFIFTLVSSNFFISSLDKKPWSFPENNTIKEIVADLQNINPNSLYILSNETWLNALSIKNYTCYFNQKFLSLCPHIAEVSYFASVDSFHPSFTTSDYFLVNDQTLNITSDPALKNLSQFIISHPQYYQSIKTYFPNDKNKITLYHLLKYPQSKDFKQLEESVTQYFNYD